MTWLFSGFADWIAQAIVDGIEQLLVWSVAMTTPVTYWRDYWAIQAREIFFTLAWSLLVLNVAYESIRLYIARDIGEEILTPGVLLRRTIVTAFWIPVTGPAIDWLYQFAYSSSTAIANVGVDLDGLMFMTGVIEQAFIGLAFGSLLLYGIIFGLFAVGILIIKFQAAARGVELALAFIAGPIFALSAIRNDDYLQNGTLGAWWREVLVCSLNQVIQTLIILALTNYLIATGFEIGHVLLSLPILWVGIKSPSILRNYAYHSGVGRAVAQGGASGITMVAVRTLAKAPF